MFRRGFTIIEVSLFLAITALIFLGVTIGVQSSIFNQRYNDSVQSFADFLRNIYSEVMNVQSAGKGNSETAIYGKLVTFGEEGIANSDEIFVYDVIGKADTDVSNGRALDVSRMGRIGANVVMKDGDSVVAAGIVESYRPKWGALIQTTAGRPFELFKGALLVIRHPKSGTVYTYAKTDKAINVNSALGAGKSVKDMLELGRSNYNGFSLQTVDFCVQPDGTDGTDGSDNRADVRLRLDAKNSAGVEVFFDENNNCGK